ncbi:DUF4328 domain-containing protein [Rhizobium paknamense]|uniref:DUF4328 domain-containing protein n=1 Tax=Rhizobium paknamense TaxID=1206817 RepID=A0ABU0I9W2_9HYPH|nr:DUF4328 domain-containing protein [Rhizobium paknamense]MDQ0455024.1 hypothetical protein [Rhizobium paknamense]
MTLETLLTRLIWTRRVWLAAALLCGILHVIAVLIYLYGAWAQYVLMRNGLPGFAQVNMQMVRLVQFWGSQLDGVLQVARFLCFVITVVWVWFAGRFALAANPERKPRFGPWVTAASWFVPIVHFFVPPVALMDIVRATRVDPLLLGEAEPQNQSRDMVLLILVAHGLYIAAILSGRYMSALAGVAQGLPEIMLHVLHLAAGNSVVVLLWLVALDALLHRMSEAQETRLARGRLPDRQELPPRFEPPTI